MAQKVNLDQECEFFSSERIDEIVILRLKENLLFRATDLIERDKVIDFIDQVSTTESIKVIIFMSSPRVKGTEEYFDFYHRVLSSRVHDKVVPQKQLEKAAIYMARLFAQKPVRSLAGLKKLINYSLQDLKNYMAIEYRELIKVLDTGHF